MVNMLTVLVDTGVFFAFYSLRDKYHMDSLGLIAHMVGGKWGKPFIHNHVPDEALNMTKYRLGPDEPELFWRPL
jgi:predicted nucleic acid-binding protein